MQLLLEVGAHLGQPPLARFPLLLDRRQPLGTARLLQPRHLALCARALRSDLAPGEGEGEGEGEGAGAGEGEGEGEGEG
jgi:hypothetical protein